MLLRGMSFPLPAATGYHGGIILIKTKQTRGETEGQGCRILRPQEGRTQTTIRRAKERQGRHQDPEAARRIRLLDHLVYFRIALGYFGRVFLLLRLIAHKSIGNALFFCGRSQGWMEKIGWMIWMDDCMGYGVVDENLLCISFRQACHP